MDNFDSNLNAYPAPGEETLDSLAPESDGTGPTDSNGYPAPEQEPTPQTSTSLWGQVVNFFKNLFQPQSVSASAPVTASFVKAQALPVPINLAMESVPVAYNQVQAGDLEILQIGYQYDPLNRLKEANYSNGSYFHYTYDEVGNRLSETTLNSTKSYVYDEANRLTSVNGTTYTWDNNGNLLSDGNQSYAYDHANRLKTVTRGTETYSFGYNGQGDRVRQVVNGDTTIYLLDLNAGLSQVLSDESSAYLYGMDQIAQYDTSAPQYFLPDALGSARQLTDANGAVLFNQSFDPFGNPLQFQGAGGSNYGYTGEQTDSTGLQFLRARYYSPQLGCFLTRDPYRGTPWQPSSLNPYVYSANNPIIYVDPSGYCPDWLTFIGQFSQGLVYEFARTNNWIGAIVSPNAAAILAPSVNESDAMLAGRVVGDILTVAVGVVEVVGGVGIAGGGAIVGCGTTLCLASAPAVAAGVTVSVYGVGTSLSGAAALGDNLGRAFCKRTEHGNQRASQGDRPTGQAWNDAQKAGPGKVYHDTETGYYIVDGDRGRAHVFKIEDGVLKNHTSFFNTAKNT